MKDNRDSLNLDHRFGKLFLAFFGIKLFQEFVTLSKVNINEMKTSLPCKKNTRTASFMMIHIPPTVKFEKSTKKPTFDWCLKFILFCIELYGTVILQFSGKITLKNISL